MKIIHPSQLNGRLKIQPSKSVCHRALICAALSGGTSRIRNVALSEDISATLGALVQMGLMDFRMEADTCIVSGGKADGKSGAAIDCGESGSTLRFLLPLGLDGVARTFTGAARLMERPMEPYEKLFAGMGYKKTAEGIAVSGRLAAGGYRLRGDVSSQFISGLLFKLPLLGGNSVIEVTSPLESRQYIEITRQVQSAFGIKSTWNGQSIMVAGNQAYTPQDFTVEGDFSHAAFFAVAAAIGGDVTLTGLDPNSTQGDKALLGILDVMGADVSWAADGAVRIRAAGLKPVDIDVSEIPDTVPALCVLLCAAQGRSRLYNAARLRYKESDRLSAMADELTKLGADITEYEDSLVINGSGGLLGGEVCSHNDHRVAMALTAASVLCKEDIVLDGAMCVRKSAPAFYEEFASLGGNVERSQK